MKDTELKKEITQDPAKEEWEAPKLICLDKSKTQGGIGASSEDFSSLTPS